MPANLAQPRRRGKAAAAPARSAAAALLAWYEMHGRSLPWRVGPQARRAGERPDPYRVWLSEVMLQQTTVAAVIPYFHRFVSRWPDVASLAAAPETAVMAAWAGLGYYSRARNLIAAARQIATAHDGRFPSRAADLARLPGVGAYTSAAIAAIAFDEAVPVVDGNVERVASRFFAVAVPMPTAKAEIGRRLAPLVPSNRPGEFAEALMDLGATICTPQRPACALCPWSDACAARAAGRQQEFPVKAAKKERPQRYGRAFVALRADGAVLLRRRPPAGLLGGMAEVPGSDWTEDMAAAPPAPPLAAEWRPVPGTVAHGFTHFRLLLTVLRAEVAAATPAPAGCWWVPVAGLAAEGLPTVMRKAVAAALPEPCPAPLARDGGAG